MKIHQKTRSWLVDYFYMFRGAGMTVIHRNPPHHYLGHIVEEKVPVILLPGILGRWSFLKKLGDKISLLGHPVYIVPKLGYNLHDIPSSAQILKSVLDRVLAESGEGKSLNAVIVAHSKGGLIGKYFLTHYNQEHHVLGMVSIATPYSGSGMAKLVPLKPFKELDTDSKILMDLQERTETNKQIISIIPEYDNHVWADQGSYLEGAENIRVAVHGHHKVTFDDGVHDIVLQSIEKIAYSA